MAVFNGENFIQEQIDSLLGQTFRDFELIISDNASTDSTEELCRAIAASDHRVRYIRNDVNIGPVANHNRLVELATGEFFKWAAHDDVHAPDFLLRCVEALDERPDAVLAFSRRIRFGEGMEDEELPFEVDTTSDQPSKRFGSFLRRPWSTIPAIFGLFRRDALLKTHLYPHCLGGDHVLLAELSLQGPFYEVPEILFRDRQHQDRCSRRVSLKDRVAWWHPETVHPVAIFLRQFWAFPERALGYSRAISSAPITLPEKIRCYLSFPAWLSFHFRMRMRRLLRMTERSSRRTRTV
ncbi:MAG: glycosyltransferase family 2 protein [Actinomycetota bacterium]